LENLDGFSNYFYLSGLLIGAEILALKKQLHQHIYVFASGALSQCYEKAIKILLPDSSLEVISEEKQESAFILGQYLIYKTFKS
jgi:2-keto-3-deoxy-galactonokinase